MKTIIICTIFFIIGALLGIIEAKNKSIKKLEKCLDDKEWEQNGDILKILYKIKAVYDDKRIITTTHDREIKDIVNHYIELYSEEQRKLDNKKELNG